MVAIPPTPLLTQAVWQPFLGREYPEFELVYREPIPGDEDFEKLGTSGWGIDSVIEQQLSFGMSSRPVSDAEFSRAKNRGEELEQIPIAADATVFITNSGVGISGLAIEQLQKNLQRRSQELEGFWRTRSADSTDWDQGNEPSGNGLGWREAGR